MVYKLIINGLCTEWKSLMVCQKKQQDLVKVTVKKRLIKSVDLLVYQKTKIGLGKSYSQE